MNRYIILLALFAITLVSKAQDVASEPAMADKMRQEGKIYVVVTVIAIIFVCIAGFLIYLDRKVKKVENELKNK